MRALQSGASLTVRASFNLNHSNHILVIFDEILVIFPFLRIFVLQRTFMLENSYIDVRNKKFSLKLTNFLICGT